MGFLEEYKRLERLCGDVLKNDRCVSAYIDEMKSIPRGCYFVRGWDEDLKQLKHYRWLRNQIVHDPECTETNMCETKDVQWVVGFYGRIMNQTDPLALYYKATHPRPVYIPQKTTQMPAYKQYEKEVYRGKGDCEPSGFESRPVSGFVVILAVIVVAVLFKLVNTIV